MSKTYEQGLQDGILLWGEGCSKMANCDECPVGVCKGAGVTCQEFAKQFPQKMVSLLKDVSNGGVSYVQEYNIRFPESNMTAEQLYENGVCRKTVFEGYVGCEGGDCIECWKSRYVGDTTESNEEVY